MQIQPHSSASIFDTLRDDWNVLLKQSACDTIFLTREFQQTWWRHLSNGGELRVLTAHDDERLVGIAPLYVEQENSQRVLRLIGGVEVADYLDIISARARHADVLDAMLRALCQQDDWHVLDLRNVPEASPTRATLSSLVAQHGLTFHEHVEEVCPIIPLPSSFDAYLDSLDKKQRHDIRRKLRKAHADADINWYCVDAQHDVELYANDFIELHQRSHVDKHDFMTAPMMAFFRELTRVIHQAGWLELAFVEMNGQRAATYFNFVYNNQTLCYNSGYDSQAYAPLSPGIVLLARLIEHAIVHGRSAFDFLQGNETYKYRMGAQDARVYRLTLTR